MNEPLKNLIKSIHDNSIKLLDSVNNPVDNLKSSTQLLLNDQVYDKSTPTSLLKPNISTDTTNPENDPNAFHPLDVLYLAWLHKDSPLTDYMKASKDSGVQFISALDRKSLVDFLEGKVESHPRLLVASTNTQFSPTKPTLNDESATASTTLPKKRYVTDVADRDFVKKLKNFEIDLDDRYTVLHGSKIANFASLQTLIASRLAAYTKSKSSKNINQAQQSQSTSSNRPLKPKNLSPIIIISSSPTALITMHNVKSFLSDAVFEPSSIARDRARENRESIDDLITIYRNKDGDRKTKWHIINSIETLNKFGPDAWDRVVCVMTTGQTWQFKQYKWSDPRDLFRNVKGVYMGWNNEPLNSNIKDWNVSTFGVDKEKRHTDKSLVNNFWRSLDSWIASNKPYLST